MKVIPAILSNDPEEVFELLETAESATDQIQIDIIDGKYADNHTIDPMVLNNVATNLLIDYHLMVVEPIKWVEKCARAQAERIIGQIERMSSQMEFVNAVHEKNLQAGIALDLDTSLSQIEPGILELVEVVLLMSVKAGFGGQTFAEKVLPKMQHLNEFRKNNNLNFIIQDDGGVGLENIDDAKHAGIDEAVVGKRLFKGNMRENIEKYLEAADDYHPINHNNEER